MDGKDGSQVRPRRSFLFVPGTDLSLFAKAIRTEADIVCIDLEDAVAPRDKPGAQRDTVAMLAEKPDFGRSEVLVRVNSLRTSDGWSDLLALLDSEAQPVGLMLPKVKAAEEIRVLDEILTNAASSLRLQVIIETNDGLNDCLAIAKASPRVDALLFGGVDMAAELRVEPTWEGLHYARTRCVHAAASAEIDLIDVPYLDLEDMAGLEREAQASRGIGMTGKGAIHPKQLPVIIDAFTPSEAEVARARQIVEAFENAGTGLVVVEKKLIEKPVLRSMYRILATAERR